MPIFEYECSGCGERIEVFCRNKDSPEHTDCPKCGTPAPKVFSVFNFQFSPFLKALSNGEII